MPPGSAKSTYASMLFPCWYSRASTRPTRSWQRLTPMSLLSTGGGVPATSSSFWHGRRSASRSTRDPQRRPLADHQWRTVLRRRRWWRDRRLACRPRHHRRPGEVSRGRREQGYAAAQLELVQVRFHPAAQAAGSPAADPDALVGGRPRRHDPGRRGQALAGHRRCRWRPRTTTLGRKPGERLWPDWFTDKQVAEAKRDPRVWASLYQQRPAPETGDFFRAPGCTRSSV
jgi:hypothetical protein